MKAGRVSRQRGFNEQVILVPGRLRARIVAPLQLLALELVKHGSLHGRVRIVVVRAIAMLIAMIAVFFAMRNRSGRLSCVRGRGRGRGRRRRLAPLPLRLEPNLLLLLLVPLQLQLLLPLLVMASLTRTRGVGRVRIARGDKENEVDAAIKGADALQVLDNVGLRRAERNQNLMDATRDDRHTRKRQLTRPVISTVDTGGKL